MTAAQTTTVPLSPDRKPLDEEIDVYGLTHQGKVRSDNQDHFLICALRKQMVVHLTSLPETDHLMAGPERLAFLAMVADGVGGGAKGAEASRMALEAVTQYVSGSSGATMPRARVTIGSSPRHSRKERSSAMRNYCGVARRAPSTGVWPPPSPCSSASGPAPTFCRWETAAATCSGTAS